MSARAQAGFTLVETVIAVAILAAAAAVLLPRARGLLDYAERARRHYLAAGQLLDNQAQMATIDIARAAVKRDQDVIIVTPQGDRPSLPIKVSNVAVAGSDVPIGEAPSPYSYYELDGQLGRKLVFIAPALITAAP